MQDAVASHFALNSETVKAMPEAALKEMFAKTQSAEILGNSKKKETNDDLTINASDLYGEDK